MGSSAFNVLTDLGDSLASSAADIPLASRVGLAGRGFGILRVNGGGSAYALLPEPQGAAYLVIAGSSADPFTLTDDSGSVIAGGIANDVIMVRSLGGGAWSADVPPELDFGRFGVTYDADPTYDNTAALVQVLKIRRNGKRLKIRVPAGEYRFATPDIWSFFTASELEATRGCEIVGELAEDEQQGVEEWGLDPATIFRLEFDDDSDFFMQRRSTSGDSTTNFGIITVRDLEFLVPTGSRGSVFDFGPDSDIAAAASFRGFHAYNCRFSKFDHAYRTGYKWGEGDATLGCFKIDKSRQSYAIKLANAYDVVIRDCAFRGWEYPLFVDSCEGLQRSGCRFINCQYGPINIGGGTLGSAVGDFIVAPTRTGIVSNVGTHVGCNAETGYLNASFLPNVGVYDLDGSGITWSIDQDGATLDLDNFPTGYDATDVLAPWTTVTLTPSDATIDPFTLIIYDVTATGATILYGGYDSAGTPMPYPCNVPAAVSGDDASLERHFGVNGIFFGDEVSVVGSTWNRNGDMGGTPLVAYCPLKKPMSVVGEAFSAFLDTGGPRLIRLHCGGAQYVGGGVSFSGANGVIDHPLCVNNGPYPECTTSLRSCIYDFRTPAGDQFDYGIVPGRGISSDNFQSGEIMFHVGSAADDANFDKTKVPWVSRPRDAVSYNYMRFVFPEFAGATVKFRVWADGAYTGANGLAVYDGVASASLYDLASGWQTITHVLDAAATLLQVNNNTTGGAACEIAWAGMTRA